MEPAAVVLEPPVPRQRPSSPAVSPGPPCQGRRPPPRPLCRSPRCLCWHRPRSRPSPATRAAANGLAAARGNSEGRPRSMPTTPLMTCWLLVERAVLAGTPVVVETPTCCRRRHPRRRCRWPVWAALCAAAGPKQQRRCRIRASLFCWCSLHFAEPLHAELAPLHAELAERQRVFSFPLRRVFSLPGTRRPSRASLDGPSLHVGND